MTLTIICLHGISFLNKTHAKFLTCKMREMSLVQSPYFANMQLEIENSIFSTCLLNVVFAYAEMLVFKFEKKTFIKIG